MSEITREEFASAVSAAITSVHHLYKEIDRLMVGLRDALAEEPSALVPLRGTFSKAGRDPGRLVVRHEYGTLFTPMLADDDVDDGDDDDEDGGEEDVDEVTDDEDAPDVGKKAKRQAPVIVADQPLLAMRVGMYDPGKPAAFEPQIEYAVMSDWAIGDANSSPSGERFMLQRYMLRRIPRALRMSAGVSKGGRLVTRSAARRASGRKKGEDRRLSCRLPCGVEVVPLYSLDSAEKLEQLARAMKAMWADVLRGADGKAKKPEVV